MTEVRITTRAGNEVTVQAEDSRTLMETIRDQGIGEVLALCGGCCSCATCHVYVDPSFVARLPPMSSDEDGMLDGTTHRRATSRLSCQIRISKELEGLSVTIAPED